MNNKLITCAYFKKRLVDLCLRSGLSSFPGNHRSRLILLKSVAISFKKGEEYPEKKVNEVLKTWLKRMTFFTDLDYNILRRLLVDEGFMTRNNDGSCYKLITTGSINELFETEIDCLDLEEIIEKGKKEIEERRKAYKTKSPGA